MRPNIVRERARCTASAIARRAKPRPAAPTEVRNRSSVPIAMRKPCPGSPSSASPRTRQSVSRSVPSGCGAITGMRSLASSPGVPAATMKADRPFAPGASPLRAKIT